MSGPRTDGPGGHYGLYPAIVTDIVGKSLGETPDHSVTRRSLELNVPIGTSVPVELFNHAW